MFPAAVNLLQRKMKLNWFVGKALLFWDVSNSETCFGSWEVFTEGSLT